MGDVIHVNTDVTVVGGGLFTEDFQEQRKVVAKYAVNGDEYGMKENVRSEKKILEQLYSKSSKPNHVVEYIEDNAYTDIWYESVADGRKFKAPTQEKKDILVIAKYEESLFDQVDRCNQKRNCSIPLENVTKMAVQMLDALDFVHKSDYLHRDIKLQNIMTKKDGDYVLIDFGAAHQVKNWNDWQGVSKHENLGTMDNLHPKLATSEKIMTTFQKHVNDDEFVIWMKDVVNFESKLCVCTIDIYALGVTIFEYYTGQPFLGWMKTLDLVKKTWNSAVDATIQIAIKQATLTNQIAETEYAQELVRLLKQMLYLPMEKITVPKLLHKWEILQEKIASKN
jgi:serine/threonine protein kinase